MSNLRRQALESRKTISRKARARLDAGSPTSSPLGSPAGSRAASRAGSRAPSRAPSPGRHSSGDEVVEEDGLSQWGIKALSQWTDDGSLDPYDVWTGRLNQVIDKMEDRDFFKGSSKGRAIAFALYANIISEHYFDEDSNSKLEDALPILMRCLKDGTGGKATIQALRAISVTVITCGDDSGTWFTTTKDPLRLCIYDSAASEGQAAAIQALSSAAYFGGANYQEVQSVLDIFLEIIQTAGDSVEAHNKPEVISAALQEWGFLSTLIEERATRLFRALDAFEEQLTSPFPDVLIAAAENIGLVYEQSYSLKNADDSESDSDEKQDFNEAEEEMVSRPYRKANWTKTHDVAIDDFALKSKLKDLSKGTMRYIKKDARKELHAVFRDTAHSVEHPWRGPRYSTAMDADQLFFYGHRLRQGGILMDRWWKLHRFAAVKRSLQDGTAEHLASNPNVSDALRNCLQAPSRFIDGSEIGQALQGERGQLAPDDDVMSQPDVDDITDLDTESDDDRLGRSMRAINLH